MLKKLALASGIRVESSMDGFGAGGGFLDKNGMQRLNLRWTIERKCD